MTQSLKSAPKCSIRFNDAADALASAGVLLASLRADAAASASMRIETDSRRVTAGDLFLAYRGVASDGHQHLDQAVRAGAACLVVEDREAVPPGTKVPTLVVTNGRAAWTWLAARAFDHPEKQLTLIGVTGTNGKTSTVWMTRELLAAVGTPCLSVGTLGARLPDREIPTSHTTPDPDQLFSLFRLAVDEGLKFAAMEVSSHALVQEKLLPLRFSTLGFTSFSRDHLDFHANMAEYFSAKCRFFTEFAAPGAVGVVNSAVPHDARLSLGKHDIVYGDGGTATVRLLVESSSFSGSTIRLETKSGSVTGDAPFFAQHALENFCAALCLAETATKIRLPPALWSRCRPVPGRLEPVSGRKPVAVVVDYAHTPDALEKTLKVLRPLARQKLHVVFGCGGDRDPGKREIMGQIAEKLADRCYVTSDNPRSERPAAIVDAIVKGFSDKSRAVIEVDRAASIRRAVRESGTGDLVLIAGKGHETYQIIGKTKHHFDDREIARCALDE